jgi:hypothetical protein
MLPLPQTPFAFDVTRFFQFILYAFMVSPGNFVWQRWLETKFPAYDRKLYGEKKEEYVDDYVTGQTTKKVGDKKKAVPNELGARERSQSLNLRNTFVKFALDSTVGTCINVSPLSPSLHHPLLVLLSRPPVSSALAQPPNLLPLEEKSQPSTNQ